jgi:integrase/recombinase XerD
MLTIEKAKQRFIFHCQFEKGLSNKTIISYSTDLSQFNRFLIKNKLPIQVELIDKNSIKKFIESISNRKPKTVKRKIATLKAMYNFLEFEDDSLINPFHKLKIRIKETKTLPGVLSLNEVQLVFKTMYKYKASIKSREKYEFKAITRDIAIVEMLFATGIRVSELCNLSPNNMDKNFESILILGKGNKERRIQIYNKETLNSIKEYSKLFRDEINHIGYFFINRLNKKLSDQSVRNMVQKYAYLAGIKKHITPHTFRHTFATLLLEENVDIIYIQHLLGHSSIMTTQIYTHVNQSKQKQILKAKHPRKRMSLT